MKNSLRSRRKLVLIKQDHGLQDEIDFVTTKTQLRLVLVTGFELPCPLDSLEWGVHGESQEFSGGDQAVGLRSSGMLKRSMRTVRCPSE